ncbi:Protein arginine N-methyltransferase 1 [Armadillidium vulgare]|nr:Protein arginine N-methyltransferase 1 [Armadillidium vulgare]
MMIKDEPRTQAYKDAIFKNEHLFKDKIVMDVGAGTGILSLFAAKAGAKKVLAVEGSKIAEYIPLIAKENGYADIIQVFHCKVEDVSLDMEEKVDIIISEWMGFYLLHEAMLSSVLYARDQFLSDEGILFPSNAKLYVSPCSMENYFNEHFYFWDNVYGFNMRSLKNYAHKGKQTKPEVCEVNPTDLLAEPVCIKEFNLRYINESDIQSFSCTNFVGITKSGIYQGLALWFVCEFEGRTYDEKGEENGSLVTLSTAPSSTLTHWKQTVIILGNIKDKNNYNSNESPSKLLKLESASGNCNNETDESDCNSEYFVEEDEVVGWKLDFSRSEEEKRHYTIVMESLDPEEAEHPIPCVCPMPRCVIIAKMIESEEEKLVEEEEEDYE